MPHKPSPALALAQALGRVELSSTWYGLLGGTREHLKRNASRIMGSLLLDGFTITPVATTKPRRRKVRK